ncbi:MAG: NAD(+) synthase [Flavobacteriales bacterium TMED113]|nr:MAG: NAD(+) synthase [Flavobacteriales bacterium TMED113]
MNDVKENITNWIKEYAKKYNKNLVIGISGGIDSAVTSTLCAETNLKTIVVSMPIHQNNAELIRAQKHMNWLKNNYKNIETIEIDLSIVFDQFKKTIGKISQNKLALANSRARLRMTTLYQIAGHKNGLVIGTGNKIEDFCIGFFTKYGDGGVDLSPIGDLMKSEVFSLAKELNIINDIQKAKPTDGLWDDGRNDEDQIGATYQEIENAIKNINTEKTNLSEREKKVIEIYLNYQKINQHKMKPIPVCYLAKD